MSTPAQQWADRLTWMMGWLDDPVSELPLSDEQRARLAQERAAEARQAERDRIERETAAEEREARLEVEARATGRPVGRELTEVLDDARAQGARQDRGEERRRRVEGTPPPVALTDDRPSEGAPRRRPPEVQAVADARGAREAEELAQDLTDAGHGGMLAGWLRTLAGRRP